MAASVGSHRTQSFHEVPTNERGFQESSVKRQVISAIQKSIELIDTLYPTCPWGWRRKGSGVSFSDKENGSFKESLPQSKSL